MAIKLEDCVSIGNGGDGVRIEGDVPVEIKGLYTAGNGGQGLNVISHASLLE